MPTIIQQIRIFKQASHDEKIAMYDTLAVPMLKTFGKSLLFVIAVIIFFYVIIPSLFLYFL